MTRHLPFLSGRYVVSAGLSRTPPQRVFDVDEHLPHYLQLKRLNLARRPDNFYRRQDCPADLEHAACDRLSEQFHQDYPELPPPDHGSIDAFARCVQEDIVVLRRDATGLLRNVAIHLCFPNHWSAEQKIGLDFIATHAPVADFDPLAGKANAFADMMVNAVAPIQRFAWGIATDDRLDHLPDDPGRTWTADTPAAFVRVERQSMLGLPHLAAALFLIRTYLYDVKALTSQERELLAAAIESMTPQTLAYKGLTEYHVELCNYMRNLDSTAPAIELPHQR
jgi:hypothetical protein